MTEIFSYYASQLILPPKFTGETTIDLLQKRLVQAGDIHGLKGTGKFHLFNSYPLSPQKDKKLWHFGY